MDDMRYDSMINWIASSSTISSYNLGLRREELGHHDSSLPLPITATAVKRCRDLSRSFQGTSFKWQLRYPNNTNTNTKRTISTHHRPRPHPPSPVPCRSHATRQPSIRLPGVLEAPDAVPDDADVALAQQVGDALAVLERRLHHGHSLPGTPCAAEPAG